MIFIVALLSVTCVAFDELLFAEHPEATVRFRWSDVAQLPRDSSVVLAKLGLDMHPRNDSSDGTLEVEGVVTRASLGVVEALRLPYRVVRNVDREYAQRYFSARRKRSSNPYNDAEGAPIHHDNADVEQFMVGVREQCQHIARVSVIGQSVEGEKLFVVRITDNPDS